MITIKSVPEKIPRIYPITDATLSGLSHPEQVECLVEGGARMVQLREKYLSGMEFFESARQSVEIAHRSSAQLIINDRVDIAIAVRADGVHLGQDDTPPVAARKIMGDAAIIGYSTHSLEQAVAASRLPVDYIAIGPIFPTITKQDPEAVVGIDGLMRVRDALPNATLVAIGGITSANLADIFEAGADSAALISAIFAKPHTITETFKRLNEQICYT